MSPAVEVVGQTQGISAAEIVLDGKIRLLRVRIDKVLGLRVAEGLEPDRERSRRQVVLIEKDRLRKIQRLKLLLVRQIAERRVYRAKRRRRTLRRRRIDKQTLEDRNGVQVAGVAGERASCSASKCKLSAGGTVRSIA